MMRTFPDTAPTLAFDPFGEPVVEGFWQVCPSSSEAGDRIARRVGGVVFWTLALVILAGRIHVHVMPTAQDVVAYPSPAVSLR
ncbi:hypothetical protein [Methylobacterium sp. WL64]|uniref:hypothetical protein n=1 Tax=Methylobacterium sp. WL64 TaxID=2603894 RepID=UPI001FEEA8E5|nr:hypothetical protein [Methylobacterium sp. WL64]